MATSRCLDQWCDPVHRSRRMYASNNLNVLTYKFASDYGSLFNSFHTGIYSYRIDFSLTRMVYILDFLTIGFELSLQPSAHFRRLQSQVMPLISKVIFLRSGYSGYQVVTVVIHSHVICHFNALLYGRGLLSAASNGVHVLRPCGMISIIKPNDSDCKWPNS